MFQSAGRIIGWLKQPQARRLTPVGMFQSAGRIIGWLKCVRLPVLLDVSVFQSAGRIIGWLKLDIHAFDCIDAYTVSIRRADYWLVEEDRGFRAYFLPYAVSIRRADYWLVEVPVSKHVLIATPVSIRRADYWLV